MKINKIFYINLEQRKDRKNHIENELTKFFGNLNLVERIEAIKHQQGGIGCGLSHIKALKKAEEFNYENIIILEDDFKFLVEKKRLEELLNILDKDYNICLLSRFIRKHNPINKELSEVINGQTTGGYLINKRFFKILRENFEEAVENLKKGDMNASDNYSGGLGIFSIDQNWKKLQGKGKKFYTFREPIGVQIESFSDLEKKVVNYHTLYRRI